MHEQEGTIQGPLPELGCACATVRRASRLVTQLFGDEMSSKVEPTQFSLLSVLLREPGIKQATVGRVLGLDKTTVSRNLRLMEKNGWLRFDKAKDGRERGFQVTALGKKTSAAAEPGWMRAQARLRGCLKTGELEQMLKVLDRLADVAMQAQAMGEAKQTVDR